MKHLVSLATLLTVPVLAGEPCAQPQSSAAFEVASIHVGQPQSPFSAWGEGVSGGPGSPDPTRILYRNATLGELVRRACGVVWYQVSGPGWLDTERFIIEAKLPTGSTEEDLRHMLQALLQERFHLAFHHETRLLPAFDLAVMRSGLKIVDSAQGHITLGRAKRKPALPSIPPLPRGTGPMMVHGPGFIQAANIRMDLLAETLTHETGGPVHDRTGLGDQFTFTLVWEPDAATAQGVQMLPAAPPGEVSSSVFRALKEQIGLQLVKVKGPVDVVVIDHIDKAPTPN